MPTDLMVIGAGSAGLTAARTAAGLGARVTLVEADRVGGDCTWTGCIPSKALIHAAADAGVAGEDKAAIRRASALTEVRRAIASVYARETPEELIKAGIEVVSGPARFRDRRTLEVGARLLTAARFVICTGAAPWAPPIEGVEEVGYLTHRTFFELERLPASLIILGGGPIAVELAQAISRLGSAVTLVEQDDRLIQVADPEASRIIAEVLSAEGVGLHLGTRVDRIGGRAGAVVVECNGQSLRAEQLLVATGRRPNTRNLGLESAGVNLFKEAIQVDDRLRTSTAGILAAGDVTGGLQFTHYAGWQGYVAARNALLPGSTLGTRAGVPWAIFTDPEIAQVGLTLVEARRGQMNATEDRIDLDHVDRAQADGRTAGFLKVVSDGGGKLLGATVVSPRGGELINELSLAIELGASIGDLARTIHVYPTYGSGIQDLAAGVRMRMATAGWKGGLIRWLIGRIEM